MVDTRGILNKPIVETIKKKEKKCKDNSGKEY